MPQKNKGKGGKRRRRGKKEVEQSTDPTKMTVKADRSKGEHYGRVTKLAGDCRVSVETPDNDTFLCHIPGKFRKRVWIKPEDIVLFCERPYEPVPGEDKVKKGDILSLYSGPEIRWLVQKNEIPHAFCNVQLTSTSDGNQDIHWNNGEAMTLSEEELENDSDIPSEEKERMREERRQRNAIPDQQRNYDLPPSDSEEEVNDQNMEQILEML